MSDLAPDLTRADAERAIVDAKRALGGLNHVAMAGILHAEDDPAQLRESMMLVVKTYEAILTHVDNLGMAARYLPEPDDGR